MFNYPRSSFPLCCGLHVIKSVDSIEDYAYYSRFTTKELSEKQKEEGFQQMSVKDHPRMARYQASLFVLKGVANYKKYKDLFEKLGFVKIGGTPRGKVSIYSTYTEELIPPTKES